MPAAVDDKDSSRSKCSLPHPGTTRASNGDSRVCGKRHESAMMHMSVMLASVGAGFDICLSNTVAIHPDLHQPAQRKDCHMMTRRDAYLGAIRDSFIEPADDYRLPSLHRSPVSNWYTYHGTQTRRRPGIDMVGDGCDGGVEGIWPKPSSEHACGDGDDRQSESRRSTTISPSDEISAQRPQVAGGGQGGAESSSVVSPLHVRGSQNPVRRSVTFDDECGPLVRSKPGEIGSEEAGHMDKEAGHRDNEAGHSLAAAGRRGQHRPFPQAGPSHPPDSLSHIPAGKYVACEAVVPVNYDPRRQPFLDIVVTGCLSGQAPCGLPAADSTPLSAAHTDTRASSEDDAPRPAHDPALRNSHCGEQSCDSAPSKSSRHKTLLDMDVEGQSLDSTEPLVRQVIFCPHEVGRGQIPDEACDGHCWPALRVPSLCRAHALGVLARGVLRPDFRLFTLRCHDGSHCPFCDICHLTAWLLSNFSTCDTLLCGCLGSQAQSIWAAVFCCPMSDHVFSVHVSVVVI